MGIEAEVQLNSGKIYAYTDESGNTGLNIFDNNQPNFWACTLISLYDLDISSLDTINKLYQTTDIQELHGNVLGLYGIEKIANDIKNYIIKYDLKFIFVNIAKRHIASLKFFDTIMDSGTNKAVSPLHYGHRSIRLPLAFETVKIFSPQDQESFWKIYLNRDIKQFCRLLKRVKWKVENKTIDPRKQTLLLDAINWALKHPNEVLDYKGSNLDSPNIIAFSLLMQSLKDILTDENLYVFSFVHDEQQQFGRFMHQAYNTYKSWSFGMEPLSWMTDIEKVDKLKCQLEFRNSISCIGLQLVDVILWLTKNFIENKVNLKDFPNCSNLVKYILENGVRSEFSKRQLEADVIQCMQAVAQLPFNEQDQMHWEQVIQEIEEDRKKRMNDILK